MYKYTVEATPETFCGEAVLRLTLRFQRWDKEATAEKILHTEELQMTGLFDLIFDDLKKELKQVVQKEML